MRFPASIPRSAAWAAGGVAAALALSAWAAAPWGSVNFDLSNGYVGINTASPAYPLDVAGMARFQNNVGIGTAAPGQSLDVNGTIRSLRDDDFPSGSLEGGQLILNKASGYALSAYLDNYMNAFRVHNGTTELLKVDLTSGNVGVGVGSPAAKLDVAGTFKLADGTQGAGKVLTSDAAGNATWQATAAASRTPVYVCPASISRDVYCWGSCVIQSTTCGDGQGLQTNSTCHTYYGPYWGSYFWAGDQNCSLAGYLTN